MNKAIELTSNALTSLSCHAHWLSAPQGQLGIELVLALQAQEGIANVDISDIRVPAHNEVMKSRFLHLDATDEGAVFKILEEGRYDAVYHLAAMLSAIGEKKPIAAWDLNMQSLLHVLEGRKRRMGQADFLAEFHRCFWSTNNPETCASECIT